MLSFPQSFRACRGRTGFTLLETLVSITLLGLIGGAVVSFFIGGMRTANGIIRQNLLSVYGRSPVEDLKHRIRTARRVEVADSGNRLNVTNGDGSVATFWLDTSSTAPRSGRLYFRPSAGATSERLLGDVTAAGPSRPLFLPVMDPTRSEITAVGIQFRLGDPLGPLAEAGSGGRHRAVDVVTTVCLRNLVE